jgi:hypothetical protein
MHNIKLSKKIKKSEKLDIDPSTTIVRTDEDREITWSINPTRKFKSFHLEAKHGDNPFDKPIPTKPDSTLTLKVDGSPSLEWEYTIHWKDDDPNEHKYDPKISINPTKFDPVPIIIAILSSLFGFLSLKFLFNKLRK